MLRRIPELLIVLAFLALSGAYLLLTLDIADPNAALFPRILGVGGFLAAGWHLIRTVRGGTGDAGPPAQAGVAGMHFAKVLGLAMLYVFAMAIVGYVAATAVFIAVGIYLLGYRNLKVVLALSVLVTIFVFVVFKTLMYASLPSSALDDWLTEVIYRYFLG